MTKDFQFLIRFILCVSYFCAFWVHLELNRSYHTSRNYILDVWYALIWHAQSHGTFSSTNMYKQYTAKHQHFCLFSSRLPSSSQDHREHQHHQSLKKYQHLSSEHQHRQRATPSPEHQQNHCAALSTYNVTQITLETKTNTHKPCISFVIEYFEED